MAEAIYRRFLAFMSRIPVWAGLLIWAMSAYVFVALSIGLVTLVFHAAFGGENGATCRGNTCYIEGTGGDVFAWVLKSGVDYADGKTLVTRKNKRCDSACAITAAILDKPGRLKADPNAVYCFCHTDKYRLATITDWWGPQIGPRWRKLLLTGKPFKYADVR